MEAEYDFSNAKRGKFYRPGATLRLPVYLNEKLQSYLAAAAERKGISLTDLVNNLLSKEIEIVEGREVTSP
jgi:predicted HicB family RNase H-like nuclease